MLTIEAFLAQPAVTPFWSMPARSMPRQIDTRDSFMVVNRSTNVAVESHLSPERVVKACNTLNEHAARCGHATRYEAFTIAKEVRHAG